MKTIDINGCTFEVIKPRNEVRPFVGRFCDESAIFCHYDRPSISKVKIWKSWLDWAHETDGVVSFEICSSNDYQFTIAGLYIDDNGDEYNIYITKAHNRLYKVN